MLKKRFHTTAVFVTMISLFGFFSFGCSREPGRHYDDDLGFSIIFPDGWEIQENKLAGLKIIMAMSPQEGPQDTLRENINVTSEKPPSSMTLDQYMEQNLSSMKKMLSGFKNLGIEDTLIGEMQVKKMVFTHQMGSMNLKVLSFFTIQGGRGYAITCTAVPETFSGFTGTFEKSVQSFRIE